MGVQWIDHKGQRILYIDHRGLKTDEVTKNVKLADEMVTGLSSVRFLANFEDAVVDTNAMAALKESGAGAFKGIVEKSAIVGVTGIRHLLLQAYNRVTGESDHQRLFDSETDALDWLAS